MSLSFEEKLQSNYYSSAGGFKWVSARDAKLDKQAAYNRERYLEAQNRLENEFLTDAFEELGITNNPKANLLYKKAYDESHSEGFYAIFNTMSNLVDLIL